MAYIENPFTVGQYALCINENFPIAETTGDKSELGTHPLIYPKKDEICCVDETLGEYLRFDEYDSKDSFNWWKHTHFKLISQQEVEKHYTEAAKKFAGLFTNHNQLKPTLNSNKWHH